LGQACPHLQTVIPGAPLSPPVQPPPAHPERRTRRPPFRAGAPTPGRVCGVERWG